MDRVYDYLIIGAGISGLQSLEILSRKTKNLLVLESQHYHGGRVLSESIVDLAGAEKIPWVEENKEALKNVFIEKGATWIQERHTYILELCKKFGIELREQNSEGLSLYLAKDRPMDSKELSTDPRYGPVLRSFVDHIDHISTIYDREVLTFPPSNPARSHKMLCAYDLMTVSEFLEQNITTKEPRDLVQSFLEHTQCVSCQENSMHEVLTKNARSNDVGILKQFLGEYGHEASYLLNKGTSEFINKFVQSVEKMRGEPREKFINYQQQVITINNKRQDFCIVSALDSKTNRLKIYKAKKVICTVPLSIARYLSFTNISRAKRFIFDNQLRTSCSKSFLIVKKPFWRSFATGDAIFSGDYMINMAHDISPPDLSCGIMVFFHNGKKFVDWESKFVDSQNEYEDRKKYIVDVACKLFKVDQKTREEYFNDCLFYASSFMNNPNIRSGFQSCTSPGTFSTISKLGEGIESFYRDENNCIFIGSEYSREYASYMEGAIRVARQKCFEIIGERDDLFTGSECSYEPTSTSQ